MAGECLRIILPFLSCASAPLLRPNHLPVTKDWVKRFAVDFEQVSLFALLNRRGDGVPLLFLSWF